MTDNTNRQVELEKLQRPTPLHQKHQRILTPNGPESCYMTGPNQFVWLVKERAMALCIEHHVFVGVEHLEDIKDPDLVELLTMSFPLAKRVNTAIFDAFKLNTIDKNVWYLLLLALLLRDEPMFEEEAMLIQKLEDLCHAEINLDLFVSVSAQFAQDRKFFLHECVHYARKFLPPPPPPEGKKSPKHANKRPFIEQLHSYFRMTALLSVNKAYEEAMQVYVNHRDHNRLAAQSLYTEMTALLRKTFVIFASERKRATEKLDPKAPKKIN
jgi:hypothetical protein